MTNPTTPATPGGIKVAALQMVSTPDPQQNRATARRWVLEAAAAGAQLVVLPEY